MINVSLPFWLFGTVVGLICTTLLATALAIGYKVRRLRSQKGHDAEIFGRATAMLNNHFQHNLLGMQVDAVFDSLSALIETERIKLKALVAPTLQSMPASIPQKRQTSVATQVQDEPAAQALEEQQVDSGHDPVADQHPSNSGLSKAERELVEKMRSFQSENHRKLEAVAW
jgi:hypothetical protein